MSNATQRTVCRWAHTVLAVPVVGYVYSPFENLPDYAPLTRYVAMPLIVLTGLWMWKGHAVRRLLSKPAAE